MPLRVDFALNYGEVVATATMSDFTYDVERTRPAASALAIPGREPRELRVDAVEPSLPELGRFEAAQRYGEPRVVADVETDAGRSEIELPLRVRELADGRTEVAGQAYRLWLAFRLGGGDTEVHWSLEPGGQDAAGRAAIVDFLIASSGRGTMVLKDPDAGAIASIPLDGGHMEPSLVEERAFLTHVLVVEAWSGTRLLLPDEPSGSDLHILAELRGWIEAPVFDARFIGEITAIVNKPPEGADRLVLHEHWWPLLFGMPVRMGRFDYDVPVRYDGTRRLDDGRLQATFSPTGDGRNPARLSPPRPSSTVEAAFAAANGLPGRPAHDDASARAERLRRAQALVEAWGLDDPEDDRAREEIRRRWPT